jgi:hypothetical protein
MGLGNVVAAASSAQGSLKKLIRARLVEDREVPCLDAKSYLRVSALADMCPREEVLASTLQITRRRVVDADLGLIFAHGHALHYILQNKVLADTGALLGVWRCVECAKQFGKLGANIQEDQTLVRKPKKCDCGCEDFHYREQHFINKEYRIGGHPDGFLVLQGMPGMGLVECKSIGSRGAWEVKQTPNVGHVVQVQCYMWLSGLQWAKILYWEKGGNGSTALIEHTIERDEETIERVKSLILSIWNGIATGLYPQRLCLSATCPRAAKCAVVGPCFETP